MQYLCGSGLVVRRGTRLETPGALHTRKSESRIIRPISEAGRISTDPDPLRVGWYWSIEDPKLEPSRRTCVGVWRRGDLANNSFTGHLREDGALTHASSVCAGGCTSQRGSQIRRSSGGDYDRIFYTIRPVGILDGESWLRNAQQEIGWYEDLDTVFLWVGALLNR